MRIISYIWSVLCGLLALGITLGILGVASSKFETAVVAALAVIYFEMSYRAHALGTAQVASNLSSAKRFAQISQLLKDENAREYLELIMQEESEFNSQTVKLYIKGGFVILIWLIAGFSILNS